MDKLTDAKVAALKPQAGLRPEIPDPGCPGLYLVVHPTGRKTYVMRYRRPRDGKHAKLTLGPAFVRGHNEQSKIEIGGTLSVAAARKLVADCRLALRSGRDPGAEEQDDKERSFSRAARLFIERYAKPKNRRWRETAQMLGLRVDERDKLADEPRAGSLVARWAKRPVSEIRKRDVVAVLDELIDRDAPYMANAMHACLRKLFAWLVERDELDENPMRGLKQPTKPEARERVLTDDELRAFWKACGQLGQPFGQLFRLLLVTGQRREEVGGMRAPELSPLGETWFIPAIRVKNGREHTVPLTDLARHVLKEQVRIEGDFIFTTTGTSSVSGFSKGKRQLDALMLAELRKDANDPGLELTPWRLHDLRRTCASGMARVGVAPHIVEALLNHTSGVISGVAAVYNRYTYETEKRQALEAWATLLSEITTSAEAQS